MFITAFASYFDSELPKIGIGALGRGVSPGGTSGGSTMIAPIARFVV